MSSVLDNIKKNDNNFSFISTFFDLVGNKEFKNAEISTLYTNAETKETSIWRSLSAVAELLGSTFYNNTLNFIDNVINVDLCKVDLLLSMMQWLGVRYIVFNDIDLMPLEVRNLMDIFSIKREYLTSYVKMDNDFVNDMVNGVVSSKYTDVAGDFIDRKLPPRVIDEEEYLALTKLSVALINNDRNLYEATDPTLSSYWLGRLTYLTAIDDTKFDSYMSSVYKSLLLTKLCATYNDKAATLIYKNLSSNILQSDFTLVNENEEQVRSYKIAHNVSLTFNEQNEVDKYERGEVDLSDYTLHLISVMQMEIDRRKKPFNTDELKTRYKFYKERSVKEYADFIKNEYSITQLYTAASNELSLPGAYYEANLQYDVDDSYIVLYNMTKKQLANINNYNLFVVDKFSHEIMLNHAIIDNIALKLVWITNSIRETREQIKTLCLKYFMRGTKLLLNATICEYLHSNIVNALLETSCLASSDNNFDWEKNYVDLIEYIDPTNYFNISTETDSLLSSVIPDLSALNEQYWKTNGTVHAIGAVDNTNLFSKLPTLDALNFIFNDLSISSFYNNTLNAKFSIKDNNISSLLDLLKDFLNHLYMIGADSSFLSDDIFHTYDAYPIWLDYLHTLANNMQKILSVEESFVSLPLSYCAKNTLSTYGLYFTKFDNLPVLDRLSSIISYLGSAECIDARIIDKPILRREHMSMLYDVLTAIYYVHRDSISDNVRLSSIVTYLSSKYSMEINEKFNEYLHAKETDSFILLQEYNTILGNYTSCYTDLSLKYAVASSYIPDNFAQENMTLCSQVSNLCMSLSSIENRTTRNTAVNAVLALSTSIENIGKLSAEVLLEIILESLSSMFDEEIGYKKAQIDVLRNSDIFKYREKLFKQYSGTNAANTPYYYMRNARHPSYMLHPYISSYIENEEYSYDIPNIANLDASEAKLHLLGNLSDLIDISGYLINVWKNPVNINTDYASKYEQVTHRAVDGKDHSAIGYDGIFYPPALADYLSANITYTIALSTLNLKKNNDNDTDIYSEDNILSGDFITSLSGCECYNVLTGIWQHVIWNPWYDYLDLTEQEAKHIATLLSVFKTAINAIARGGLNYDITRYGLDIFNNSYILIKDKTGKDDIELKRSDGILWIRIKNHPIAFPAYAYKYTESSNNKHLYDYQPYLQITVNSLSNTEVNCFKRIYLPPHTANDGNNTLLSKVLVPAIQDFTFSNNGDAIVLNGVLKPENDAIRDSINASYPVIANVNLQFNVVDNLTLYFHEKEDVDNPIYSIIDLTTISTSLSDWCFETYFYDEAKIGVIYSNLSSVKNTANNIYETSISVAGAHYDLLNSSTTKRKIMKPVEVEHSLSTTFELENVCVDAYNNTMIVAYLNNLSGKLVNYCSNDIDLNEISTLLYRSDTTDTALLSIAVKTKQYQIGDYQFFDIKDKTFIKYTDPGFFGLTELSNTLGHTNIAKHEIPTRGIYKFLLLSKPVPISNMIDFRRAVITRAYEGYANSVSTITTPQNTSFDAITYMSAHIYEVLNDATGGISVDNYGHLTSNVNIYDPYEFRNLLVGLYPKLKIDENFVDTLRQISDDIFPSYLYILTSIPGKFVLPWGLSNVSAGNCFFSVHLQTDVPHISVQWGIYNDGNNSNILIDFNPIYNSLGTNSTTNPSLTANTYNLKNLFLSLPRRGDAGYLRIYKDPLNNNYSELARFYIKNMSDDKPKFLLSVDLSENESNTVYPAFLVYYADAQGNIDANSNTLLINEDGLLREYIASEVPIFKQLLDYTS